MTTDLQPLKPRLVTLLGALLDRGALLRELYALARDPRFGAFADVWAPALFERDAAFFTGFLLRELGRAAEAAPVIRDLLPRAEAGGHDTLFQGLYRYGGAPEDEWNDELRALAASPAPIEEVAAAVARRGLSRRRLHESTALALLRRDSTRFGPFVVEHMNGWWQVTGGLHTRLLAEARQLVDEELYWQLFRQLAGGEDWQHALDELARTPVPPERVDAELRRRHPAHVWQADANTMRRVLRTYGLAALTYVEDHIGWTARREPRELLAEIARLGDETRYWQAFFRIGNAALWNAELDALLARPLDCETLRRELARRTPPDAPGSAWRLTPAVALALYRRDPDGARPLLLRCVHGAHLDLFAEAEARGDDELLDRLTFECLCEASQSMWLAYPSEAQLRWSRGNRDLERQRREAQERIARICAPPLARLARLHAASPDEYVQHAAQVLAQFRAFEIWSVRRERAHNPLYRYLAEQHRADWVRSRAAVRELLESPNIFVQNLALELLAEGGPAAAPRVLENLHLLRALLLGRSTRSAKKRVLACLEHAARQSRTAATLILPVLAEVMDYRGRRAISERVLVSYVRSRREANLTTGAQRHGEAQ
jgi:hypothetical protein